MNASRISCLLVGYTVASAICAVAFGGASSAVCAQDGFAETPSDPVASGLPIARVDNELAPQELLSVEETVGLVFQRSYFSNLHLLANPRAKPVLYRILENDDLANYHKGVWIVLGYIGDADDVERLETALFRDFRGVLDSRSYDIVNCMLKAVGLMAGRNVDAAMDLADRMMKPAYWQNAPFRWHSQKPPARPGFVYYSLLRFLGGYAFSLDPGMREKVALVLQRIGEPEEGQFGPYFTRESFFNPDTLAETLLASARNQRKYEFRRVTTAQRRAAGAYFNGDLANPRPARRRPSAAAPVDEGLAGESSLYRLKSIAEDFYYDGAGHIISVQFSGDRVTNETIELLKEAPRIHYLFINKSRVDDDGLKQLAQLNPRQLRHLALSRLERLSDEGMTHVGRLTTLTKLDLKGLPNVTDDALRRLTPLRKLAWLQISRCNITDAGFVHLGRLEALEQLAVYSPPIIGDGLRHLAPLEKLKGLLISGALLDQRGVDNLKLLTQLDGVKLRDISAPSYRGPITQQTIDELRRALPTTRITARLNPP